MVWASSKGVMAMPEEEEETVVFGTKPAAVRPSRHSGVTKKKSIAVAAKKGANKAEMKAKAKRTARGEGLYKANKPPPPEEEEETVLSPWKGVDTQNKFAALDYADEMAIEGAEAALSPKKIEVGALAKMGAAMESAAVAVKVKAAEISKQVGRTAARAKENAQRISNKDLKSGTPPKLVPSKPMAASNAEETEAMAPAPGGTPIARRTRRAAKVLGDFTCGVAEAVNSMVQALSPMKAAKAQMQIQQQRGPTRLRA